MKSRSEMRFDLVCAAMQQLIGGDYTDDELAVSAIRIADAVLERLGLDARVIEAEQIQKELGIEAPGSYMRGWNAALEEAAKSAENCIAEAHTDIWEACQKAIAKDIRALKKGGD